VEVRRISKCFGDVTALDDVLLDIGEGDFLAVLRKYSIMHP
jgi:ABC-type Fe3+/spermidine/putrescine transport system ATPase subunit